ncbi:Protein geranylgeranyltransferase type II, beta subunit [Pseudoloma neurophilia]|uniref:Geranylgeranyl transferase type II subunit beta n=1 Tax=Pseudoloma neurophilia TaxID=146866 RepID=A0A0R0M143_9MICR|nr:Protein geranylgeranyltransferase type II, beta subunit [Pseudoloma neurophilia]
MERRQAVIRFMSTKYDSNDLKGREYLELFYHCARMTIFNILNYKNEILENETSNYLNSVSKDDGGFCSHPLYPSSTFETFLACKIQTDLNHDFYNEKTVDFIMSCYSNGIFYDEPIKDEYIELNNRFNASALMSLVLLDCNRRKTLDFELSDEILKIITEKGFDLRKTVDYLKSSLNGDGGFGPFPGAESHAAMSYCCLISLNILNALDEIDLNLVSKFLISLQNEDGGFASRHNKTADGCYGFWCVASLDIIGKMHLLNKKALTTFLDNCFSKDGYSHNINSPPDTFHTLYVILGLEILKNNQRYQKGLHFGLFKKYEFKN